MKLILHAGCDVNGVNFAGNIIDRGVAGLSCLRSVLHLASVPIVGIGL